MYDGRQDEKIVNFHCPRFKELPSLPLYKDQVIEYIDRTLRPLYIQCEEKVLTPTMLNNYVKQKVIPAPIHKKYNSEHIAYLIVVCIFKQLYSLSEVSSFISIQTRTYPIDDAYDYFCRELEKHIKEVFVTRNFSSSSSASKVTAESELLRSIIISFVNKIYTEKLLVNEIANIRD